MLKGLSAAYALGLLHAGLIGLAVAAIFRAFIVVYAEARNQLAGIWGEEFTAEELGRMQRRGVVWGSVDGIALQGMDIDHLAVTRRAGLLAIDSKHRARLDEPSLAAMARSARAAATKADSIMRDLRVSVGEPKGLRASPAREFRVNPVIVVWGRAQRDLPRPIVVDRVPIVPGRAFGPWLSTIEVETVSESHAAELLVKLHQFRERHNPR